jgi:hypothetical protein
VLITQPLLPIIDAVGLPTGFVSVGGPIDTQHAWRVHGAMRSRGRQFVGFTSHGRFPFDTPVQSDMYRAMCVGWCSGFQDDSGFGSVPLLSLSHSDLVDLDWIHPGRFAATRPGWDYVYVCPPGPGSERAKGWALARDAVVALSAAGLRGLLIGRVAIPDMPANADVTLRGRVRWDDFLGLLGSARCLLVTAVDDASPRVLTEALALDRPIVVNRAIIAGSKYVNAATGTSFVDASDVVTAVASVIAAPLRPREWLGDYYGLARSGRRLLGFLNGLGGGISGPYATLANVPVFDSSLDI